MSLNVIWIDGNIDNKENAEYLKDIKSNNSLIIETFKNTDDAIKYMKKLLFQETKVILSGRLYSKFIKDFKENLKEIFVVPKIIVFTGNKEKFIGYNKEYLNSENIFYSFGGIATSFIEIKEFLKDDFSNSSINNLEISNEKQLIFEYLDDKNKLMLPLFYKSFLDNTSIEKINEYTNYLYNYYSNNNIINKLLGPIKSVTNIPIEILSKYYARLYTIISDFYKDINIDLRLNKIEKHLPYIKALYEGVKLKSLPLSEDKILYRGSKISNDEINKIKEHINYKSSIVFSKSFLSFYKEEKIAESYLNSEIKEKNLSKVLFILEKNDNIKSNIMTHCSMEKLSFYSEEKEVLFFPFSSFEIKDIKETEINNEKIYQIKLLYLGDGLKDIKDDMVINLSDREFKKTITDLSLIKKEEKENNEISIKKEVNNYIKNNNNDKNIIISEVNISSDDIDKDIQIINSYENHRKIQETKENYKPEEYNNKEDIQKYVEIKINGKTIPFSYMHRFKKEGKYKIEYIFKKNLTKINHMFYGCWKLTSLDLSNFNTQEAINISYMFYDCFSLITLNLSNFNTQKAEKIDYIFNGCKSLEEINLANAQIQNIKDNSSLFSDCNSLKKKIISLKTLNFE